MQSPLDLYILAEKYVRVLPALNLDGEEQEEHSTMLFWHHNQVYGGTTNQTFVERCLIWLDGFTPKTSPHLQGNAF